MIKTSTLLSPPTPPQPTTSHLPFTPPPPACRRYVMCGSDDMNIRLWKASASKKLGKVRVTRTTTRLFAYRDMRVCAQLMPRERRKLEYLDKLKARYANVPELRRIAKCVGGCERAREPWDAHTSAIVSVQAPSRAQAHTHGTQAQARGVLVGVVHPLRSSSTPRLHHCSCSPPGCLRPRRRNVAKRPIA